MIIGSEGNSPTPRPQSLSRPEAGQEVEVAALDLDGQLAAAEELRDPAGHEAGRVDEEVGFDPPAGPEDDGRRARAGPLGPDDRIVLDDRGAQGPGGFGPVLVDDGREEEPVFRAPGRGRDAGRVEEGHALVEGGLVEEFDLAEAGLPLHPDELPDGVEVGRVILQEQVAVLPDGGLAAGETGRPALEKALAVDQAADGRGHPELGPDPGRRPGAGPAAQSPGFDQGDGVSCPGQLPGGQDPGDAPADDDDFFHETIKTYIDFTRPVFFGILSRRKSPVKGARVG